jgi:large subunit ribosomal protein L25
MTTDEISLTLEPRTVIGKQVRQLRRDGLVPAVIHDHGNDSVHVMAPYIALSKAYSAAGKHHPVSLTVGSKKYMALIKQVDLEPRKQSLRHVVFNAIKADEKQQTEVPVHFVEEAEIPAEKAGLMVIRNLDAVEIEALPKDLVDSLTVDPSGLTEIGDKVTVADIKVPTGITILTEAEHPIATVEETKAQMSEEAEAEAEGGEASADESGEAGGDDQAAKEEAKTDES